MSRQKALEAIETMRKKEFYNGFEELPERRVYFAVAHNNRCSEKEAIKRLLKGEKIIGKGGKDVTMVYGYGKLLGTNKVPKTEREKEFLQYIIYDTVILVGKEAEYNYDVFHEGWIKLGNWVKRNYLRLDKQKVVFT